MGKRNLYDIHQIYQDSQIPELLKDAAECLEQLNEPGSFSSIGIRRQLLHQEFDIESESVMKVYEISTVIEYIQSRSDRKFSVRSFNIYQSRYETAWASAWNIMVACGPDKKVYDIYNIFSKGTLSEWSIWKTKDFRNGCGKILTWSCLERCLPGGVYESAWMD